MDLKLQTKQIIPAVVNLKQYSSTDTLIFTMDEYIYESHDLSKYDCYAVCDKTGEIDKVKLTTEIVDEKLVITWKVTDYTTQKDGHINYQIVFGNLEETKSALWYSYNAIILVNSSIDADEYIVANYPSLLQQWEQRMNQIDSQVDIDLEEIRNAVETTTGNATQTSKDARDSKNALDSIAKIENTIKELVGYEPVDAVGQEVMQARGEYALLGDRLDAIEAQGSTQTTINREYFEATQDQHEFVLTKGTYTLGGNHLQVAVNGIQQPADILIEVNETTFRLHSSFKVDAGDIVDVTYFYLSEIPNVETPDGAQRKVDALETKVNARLDNQYTKSETDSAFEKKAVIKKTTLTAKNWSNSKTYNLSFPEITETTIQHVAVQSIINAQQYDSFANASIVDGGQVKGTMTLKSMGDVPKVDIPITVVIEGVS